MFQLTAARRRLPSCRKKQRKPGRFQLTAARRRLLELRVFIAQAVKVSTHSRPKAAAAPWQPLPTPAGFQLTAARRRLPPETASFAHCWQFQLTAARRRLHEHDLAVLRE